MAGIIATVLKRELGEYWERQALVITRLKFKLNYLINNKNKNKKEEEDNHEVNPDLHDSCSICTS